MVSRNAVREKVKAEILDDARTLKDDFANGKVLFQSVGKRAAERYLLKLCDLARTLTRHLEEMPNEAWEALCFPFPDPSDLRSDLIKRVIRPASEAIQTIRDDPPKGQAGELSAAMGHDASG